MKHAGYDKLRITLVLADCANGRKPKPFVVLNRKGAVHKVVKKFQRKLVLAFAGRSWMDDTLTKDYLKGIIGPKLFPTPGLLVWDSFKCHISEETRHVMKSLRLSKAFFLKG